MKLRHLRLPFTLLVSLVVAALLGLPLYVFPPGEVVRSADLAVVLGPPTKQRINLARDLLADGTVDRLLVSVGEGRTGQTVCLLERSSCFVPSPFTTLGEVVEASDVAASDDLQDLVFITKTSHVSRTRFILLQCGVDATVVGVDQPMSFLDWVQEYVYQTLGYAKAMMIGCDPSAFQHDDEASGPE